MVCLAFLLATAVSAQETMDIPFPCGLYFGASSSSAEASNGSGYDPRTGRTGIVSGAFAEFPIVDNLYFRPELTYVQKGSRNFQGTLTRLNYAEVPLLVEAKFPGEGLTFFVPFGLGIGYLGSADTFRMDESVWAVHETAVSKVDVTLQAGAGVTLQVDPHWDLFLMFRLSQSLTDAARLQSAGGDASYYSRAVSLSIGFVYDEKRLP